MRRGAVPSMPDASTNQGLFEKVSFAYLGGDRVTGFKLKRKTQVVH
jgi:hypothetical protein